MIPFALFRPSKPIEWLAYEYPSVTIVQSLWRHYMSFVHPIHKIFLEWQKRPLIERVCTAASTLTPAEHAFVLNLLLFTVSVLTEDRCLDLLNKERSKAYSEYQRLAEYALWDAGITNLPSIENHQAFIMYTVR